MPIAVMIESSENTMSMAISCITNSANARIRDGPQAIGVLVWRLDLVVDLVCGLGDKKQSTANQNDIAPGYGNSENRK